MNKREACLRCAVLLLAALFVSVSLVAQAEPTPASGIPKLDKFMPVALDQVKLAGEFGRRMQVTVENSLLNLDIDKDFLRPFQEKKTKNGCTGLGMLIDCSARLAFHTGDPRILALKRYLVKTLIDAQQPDGYLGEFDSTHRLWAFVDIQELAYLIQGLLTDYRLFHEERSLAAARKQADHILEHWGRRRADWPKQLRMTDHMTNTGVERARCRPRGKLGSGRARTGDKQCDENYRRVCRGHGTPRAMAINHRYRLCLCFRHWRCSDGVIFSGRK